MRSAFRVILVLLFLGSFLTFLYPWHYLIEINTNLSQYYLLCEIVALFLFPLWRFRRRIWPNLVVTIVICLLIFLDLVPLISFYLGSQKTTYSKEVSYSVLFANVFTPNTSYRALRDQIERLDPDLVGLVEIDQEWDTGLDLGASYPYQSKLLRKDNYGIGLFSKKPFVGSVLTDFGPDLVPALLAKIQVGESIVLPVAVLHCNPPQERSSLTHNKILLRRVATKLREYGSEHAIVMGDFNATPYSRFYSHLNGDWLSVRNAAKGFGLYRSWNAQHLLAYFPIDHIFVGNAFHVTDFKRLDWIGSDHYPIYTSISLATPKQGA